MENSVPTQHLGTLPPAFLRASIWIAGAWAIFLGWFGRHEMLDDALIHLRYAQVLHDRHFISFDGIHPSYGASSLLYVGLLALLRSFTHSPLLPKAVSVVGYAGLLAQTYRIARTNRLALALIFVLVSPFAVRWLTDGMETSLTCVLATAFAMLVYRKASPAALASIALIISLLRVDMTFMVAFGVLLLLDQEDWLRAAALCLGSGLSVAFIWITMGHILPDTAVAKVGATFYLVLYGAVREIVGTASFGVGVIVIWIASATLAWSANRRSAIIANLPFPILVLLAALRGQQIHGIRYIIWALLFSIVWNLLACTAATVPQRRPVLLTAFACVLIICWIFELPVILRVDRGRAETLNAMAHGNLNQLHGGGMAADVGFIGYFSGAPICDLNGLINGRAAAEMSGPQRADACVAQKPAFLFLSDIQVGYFDVLYGLQTQTDFFNCGSVAFTNVASDDRHWLFVRRSEYPQGCPAHL